MPSTKDSALSPKEARFVEEYLKDLNATQAAIRAGYSEKTAKSIGHELLTRPHVKTAIDAAKRERSARTGISQDRVLRELARIAFLDIRRAYDKNGQLFSPQDMPSDIARALSSIQTHHIQVGNTVAEAVIQKVKFNPKIRALEILLEHVKESNKDAAKSIELIIRDYTEDDE